MTSGAVVHGAALTARHFGAQSTGGGDAHASTRMALYGQDMAKLTPQEEIKNLEEELLESKLEIKRHHIDFERIRTVLDHFEHDRFMTDETLVKEIRNIVG